MNIFLKSVIGTLVSLVLYLVLSKQGKDISALLSIAVCCMLGACAISCIRPVITFLEHLSELSGIDLPLFQTVLRTTGIGLLAEFVSLICTDAGNSAMAKSIQLLAGIVVLWLSLPIFTQLIELIEETLRPL